MDVGRGIQSIRLRKLSHRSVRDVSRVGYSTLSNAVECTGKWLIRKCYQYSYNTTVLMVGVVGCCSIEHALVGPGASLCVVTGNPARAPMGLSQRNY